MNNFRLSTYLGSVESLSNEEINLLIDAKPSIKHLKDGRQIDIDTNKVIRNRSSSSVYEIIQPSGEVLVMPNLAKAAEFINVGFNTLQRRLAPEGLELIRLILDQMNNNRLSTNGKEFVISREQLLSKVKDLLVKPSNLELKEDGRIFIKSLGRFYNNNTKPLELEMVDESGSLVKTWPYLTSCAEDLGLSKSGIQKRLKNATRFMFEGRTVYLKK